MPSKKWGNRKERVRAILPVLKATYPDAKCSLDYAKPLELLVATILSAQCTDERVNLVTKTLFKKYKTAKAYAADRAARDAATAAGCGVLVSLGGDVAVAGSCPPGGWTVRLADDASTADPELQPYVREADAALRRLRRNGARIVGD